MVRVLHIAALRMLHVDGASRKSFIRISSCQRAAAVCLGLRMLSERCGEELAET
jgi:hypothetical protein